MTEDLWTKPERFGDADEIFLRQYKVNMTSNLEVVTDHAVLTESDVFIQGMGVFRWLIINPKAPTELELVDQTTPIGSPWPKEERKPHVAQKIPYNHHTRGYPGPLSIYALLYGWHTSAMNSAQLAHQAWCEERRRDLSAGSWRSNFCALLQYGPWKDHPAWADVGHCGSDYTKRLKPMLRILRDFREDIKRFDPPINNENNQS